MTNRRRRRFLVSQFLFDLASSFEFIQMGELALWALTVVLLPFGMYQGLGAGGLVLFGVMAFPVVAITMIIRKGVRAASREHLEK